jgi:nitrate/nitrite transporter NarK
MIEAGGVTREREREKSKSTWIKDWDPEDASFWAKTGKGIARRNLLWSIVAENLGFSIWLIWSVVATKLPKAGFHYSTDQLFDLVAYPGLVGALKAAIDAARIESATVLGFVSAIGACGGYLIPRAFGASIKSTGSAHSALVLFLVFYGTCVLLTQAFYMRKKAAGAALGSLEAQV